MLHFDLVYRRYHQRKISVSKTTEELELVKIKELRKAAGEHLEESKKSFKKIMAKQEPNEKQEDNTKESNNQQIGTKRRRVCFMCDTPYEMLMRHLCWWNLFCIVKWC